jgi:hypothetical protein
MTRAEIKPSAMLAFTEALDGSRGMLDAWLECHDEADVQAYIKHHVEQSVAAEREACAKTCEEFEDATDRLSRPSGYECAEAIRERSKT